MIETQESSNSWLLWLSVAIIAIVIVALLLLAVFFANGSNDADANAVVTPISGGVAVPPSISDIDDSNVAGSDAAQAETDANPEPLAVGVKVTNISPNGRGTRLYSLADSGALVMDNYKDGATFVVVEPSDDHEGYPVVNGDVTWYRVRTSDGLVGWVMAEHVVPIE